MDYHKPVTFDRFTHLPSDKRPAAIEEQLKTERAAYRTARAGSHAESVAQRNVETLEQWLASAESNERLRTERIAALDAAREQQRRQAAADLETSLRAEYDRALPKPTSDQEWAAVRESVLHRHALAAMNQREADRAEMTRRIRF